MLNCPKCKISLRATDKFCPACGRNIGFGIRTEGDIRAALNRLDVTTFSVPSIELQPSILADVALSEKVLLWVLGESNKDPVDNIVENIKFSCKVRRSDE